MIGKDGICNACAKVCHENHNTIQADTTNSYICNCGANKDASCDALVLPRDKRLCTFTETKKKSIPQYFYKCITCTTEFKIKDDYLAVCARCVGTCHQYHNTVPRGFFDFHCECGEEKHSKCTAMGRKEEEGTNVIVTMIKNIDNAL